ncbi:hypothetical protein PLESTB_000595400 [Pleodorina starrii]|uniref:Uncharacterized protein n=1 Tax=Pleodorina starrii TaxID=330485 RepID=A0A9W6F0V5_9CHLO|nr:hypothetical protein PLESTB_000595400 [Pleodorina starrii]
MFVGPRPRRLPVAALHAAPQGPPRCAASTGQLPRSARYAASLTASLPASVRARKQAPGGATTSWEIAPAQQLPAWRAEVQRELPGTALSSELHTGDRRVAPKLMLGAAAPREAADEAVWEAWCNAAVQAAMNASPGTFVSINLLGQGRHRGVVLNPAPGLRAENAAGAFLRRSSLPVDFQGTTIEVAVQPYYNLARPHSHKLLIKGLPGTYALEGVTGALLSCAGLAATPSQGQDLVVGEVLGDGMTHSGTPGALPDASHLVAFVAAPPSDPNLLSLPRSFLIDQLTVRISVFDMRDAPVTDSPAAPAAEPPPAPAAGPPPAVQAAPGAPAAGDGTHPAAEPAPTAAPALGRPAAVGVAVMAAGGSPGPLPAPAQAPRPPAAHPSGPPTPSTAGSGPPAPSPASAALSPSSPGMADGQAWWRRPQLVEAPDGPNSLPAVLWTIQDAQNRRLSPYPRAGVGANPQGWGPDSTPIGGTFSPPAAEPATLAAPPGAHQGSPSGTPHQEQQGPFFF